MHLDQLYPIWVYLVGECMDKLLLKPYIFCQQQFLFVSCSFSAHFHRILPFHLAVPQNEFDLFSTVHPIFWFNEFYDGLLQCPKGIFHENSIGWALRRKGNKIVSFGDEPEGNRGKATRNSEKLGKRTGQFIFG